MANNPRFTVTRYARWWWAIMDNRTQLYVQDESPKKGRYCHNNILLFKKKEQAENAAQKLQIEEIEETNEREVQNIHARLEKR